MPIRLSWWSGGEVLEYACHGRVDGEELIERNVEALRDPRFPAIRRQLCDMEAVTEFVVSPSEIRRIIDIDFQAAEVAPAMTRIAIACQEDIIFGYGRMYEMLLDGRIPGWEVGVFRTRGEAMGWLGVAEPS